MEGLFRAEGNLAAVGSAREDLFVEGDGTSEDATGTTTLESRRARDYVGGALWHHTLRSTEYFSRWIEMKETGTESGTELSVSDRE